MGRETIKRLASVGYAVVVNYVHDQRAAESTVEAVLEGRGTAVTIRADVADVLDVERLSPRPSRRSVPSTSWSTPYGVTSPQPR